MAGGRENRGKAPARPAGDKQADYKYGKVVNRMGDQKAVFFDIDGTLWDRYNYIPSSAAEAIRRLQAGGHLAFINTGRTRAFIQDPNLLGIGFDGIISGCGTLIEYHDRTLFEYEFEPRELEEILQILDRYRYRTILEGRDYLYFEDKDFADDPYGQKLIRELGSRRRTIRQDWGRWICGKLSADMRDADRDDRAAVYAALSDRLDFIIHNDHVVEFAPAGYSKGSGLKHVCSLLGINMEDTYAFGDSVNDTEMFRMAGTAVVMGNAPDHVKAMGDHVTDSLYEDGILTGLTHLGLI